jgi:uncharacterized BrkB/YihY/UPF0761 family membrane protein
MSMNIWKWLSALCAFQFILMVIAVSLFYYPLHMQLVQLSDFLFGIWLSVATFLIGTPLFWLYGIEVDKRHRTKANDNV